MSDPLHELRTECESRNWTLNVRTRKLAGGPKRYFRIRGKHIDGAYPHNLVRAVVKKHFPSAYLTSGSCGGLTGTVDLTYAEEESK